MRYFQSIHELTTAIVRNSKNPRKTGFRGPRHSLFILLALALNSAPNAGATDEIAFKLSEHLNVKEASLPYDVYLRLSDISPTRIGADAFVDLRGIQANAPGLLSRVLDDTCKRKLAVAISDVSASGETMTVQGQFQAKFFACNTRDPKVYYRGVLLLGQNVNFQATARADVRHPCVRARLVDVQLDPLGLIGGAANLFGLTDLAERLIVEKAEEALKAHPVCPKLPAEIASLDPRYTAGGVREISQGGVGAALSGSADTSAATLLDLVRVMKTRGVLGPENQ
ncbi:MAG: hypothetical protein ABJH07_25165 [Sedimentitalea sp.]|uniref:hypothetical protein n=1 Tax=Sedimentitalea sp. TaxID=2048915 RepID=UPI003262E3B2